MKLSCLPAILSLILIPFSMNAQTGTEPEFREMLDKMYKKTVPLVQPEQVSLDGATILDTRQQEEYVVSHLPGAKFVDYGSFKAESLEDLPKDTPILVYCSVGYRSERVGEKLQEAGFTNVKNLYGGIFYWYFKGGDIVNMSNAPTDRIHTYNEKWGKWCLKGEKVN
ncbi:MAG: rhodanese-like domain-containing protein [Bacteroidia bacterium]|nr:rhodanese-like domain-containing protein [Bacteroidia bacterium]